MASHSSFATAANIFAAPNEAFASIKARPTVLLPLAILVLGYCAVSLIYMNSVDLPWFMEQQIEASSPQLSDAEREQALRAASVMSPMTLGAIGAVTSSLFVVFWIFVIALYYTGVSFATNDGIKLKQWFALVCWCTLPIVLGIVASIVNIVAGDARFMLQDQINPLSFGSLFSIDPEGASIVQRILLGMDVTALWSMVLMVLGYQAWTARSIVTSVAVVLGPIVLIVAIATLVALL